MFKWFKAKARSVGNTMWEMPKSDNLDVSNIEPGRPPEEMINRLNQIKWNDWNNTTTGTVFFRSLGLSGVTFNNSDGVSRQEILARMQRWEALDLVREPENPHDRSAVAVYSGMGQIGYIEKAWCHQVARMMDSGWSTLAKLSALYGGEGNKYGGKVEIHLSPPDDAVTIRAKVVGISGENSEGDYRIDIAEGIEDGEMVELSLDDDYEYATPRILVDLESGGNVGRLDKKSAEILAPLLEEDYLTIASLEEVELDDENKPKVTITVTAWLSEPE